MHFKYFLIVTLLLLGLASFLTASTIPPKATENTLWTTNSAFQQATSIDSTVQILQPSVLPSQKRRQADWDNDSDELEDGSESDELEDDSQSDEHEDDDDSDEVRFIYPLCYFYFLSL